jgi:XTP/dITP diphosphohydrolase
VSANLHAELLLATTNPGKRREFGQLLPPGIILTTLDDIGLSLPPETGATFAANADLKAKAASRQSGLLALADDSGIEVAALDGAPGVRSARFAGEPRSDERNRTALLEAMRNLPSAARTARFVCAVSVAKAGTVIARSEGTLDGVVATAPRGSHGFGYDPLFQLPDGRTMAELSASEKNEISHRAVAYRRIVPILLSALGIDLTLGVAQ